MFREGRGGCLIKYRIGPHVGVVFTAVTTRYILLTTPMWSHGVVTTGAIVM